MLKSSQEFYNVVMRNLNSNKQYYKKMGDTLLDKYNQTELKCTILDINEFKNILTKVFEMTPKYIEESIQEIDITKQNFKKVVEIIEKNHNKILDCNFNKYYNLYKTGISLIKEYHIRLAKINYLVSKADNIIIISDFEISLDWMNQITYFDFENMSTKKQIEDIDLEMKEICNNL